MSTTLKKQYDEKIAPALMKQFNYRDRKSVV